MCLQKEPDDLTVGGFIHEAGQRVLIRQWAACEGPLAAPRCPG